MLFNRGSNKWLVIITLFKKGRKPGCCGLTSRLFSCETTTEGTIRPTESPEFSQLYPSVRVSSGIYPIDFKMHRDGKGANPREHS